MREERLVAVLSKEERRVIERAMEKIGQESGSAFLRWSAMEKARSILARENRSEESVAEIV